MIALISFMSTPAKGAVGSLDYPVEERKRIAKLSTRYKCSRCGVLNSSAFAEKEKLVLGNAPRPEAEAEVAVPQDKENAKELEVLDQIHVHSDEKKREVHDLGLVDQDQPKQDDQNQQPQPEVQKKDARLEEIDRRLRELDAIVHNVRVQVDNNNSKPFQALDYLILLLAAIIAFFLYCKL